MAFATSTFAAAQVRDSNRGLIVIASLRRADWILPHMKHSHGILFFPALLSRGGGEAAKDGGKMRFLQISCRRRVHRVAEMHAPLDGADVNVGSRSGGAHLFRTRLGILVA